MNDAIRNEDIWELLHVYDLVITAWLTGDLQQRIVLWQEY